MIYESKSAREVAMQRGVPRSPLEAHLSGTVGLASHSGLAGDPFLNSAPQEAQIRALKAKITQLEAELEKERNGS